MPTDEKTAVKTDDKPTLPMGPKAEKPEEKEKPWEPSESQVQSRLHELLRDQADPEPDLREDFLAACQLHDQWSNALVDANLKFRLRKKITVDRNALAREIVTAEHMKLVFREQMLACLHGMTATERHAVLEQQHFVAKPNGMAFMVQVKLRLRHELEEALAKDRAPESDEALEHQLEIAKREAGQS